MSKLLLVFSSIFSFVVLSSAQAFKMPEAEEYFSEWIVDYRSIVAGEGPIPVEIIKSGEKETLATGKMQNFDSQFKKKNNQSAIVLKNGKLVYEAYNQKWDGSKTNLIHGQSMTKTVTGLTVGALICSGKIESIDDNFGKYSPVLEKTPFANISIRSALQMRSGVNKYDPDSTWDIWWMVTGDEEHGFAGKNHIKHYIQTIESVNGDGKISEYHPHDSYALSILASELTSKSLGESFYDLIFRKIYPSGDLVWMTDADGVSIPTSGLFLQARDWAKIGHFIAKSLKEKDCIGRFLQDGIDESAKSSRLKGWKYGYHFWTNKGLVILAGYGGQTMFINPKKGNVVFASSVNPKYGDSSVFGVASKIAIK